jgi:hypothetical protein
MQQNFTLKIINQKFSVGQDGTYQRQKKHWIHNFARDNERKNNCLYTRDDTGTLTGNGVQNFVPLCQRYKKNMAKRKKKIMQGYTAMAKDFIGWRLHNFAREKEKKWQN